MHYREGVGSLLIRLIIKRRETDAYRAVSSCLRQSRLIRLLKFYQHMYMYRHIYNLQLEKRKGGREAIGIDGLQIPSSFNIKRELYTIPTGHTTTILYKTITSVCVW